MSHLCYCRDFLAGVFLLSLSFLPPPNLFLSKQPERNCENMNQTISLLCLLLSLDPSHHWDLESSRSPAGRPGSSSRLFSSSPLLLRMPSLPGLDLAVSSAWRTVFPAAHMAHLLASFVVSLEWSISVRPSLYLNSQPFPLMSSVLLPRFNSSP